MAKILTKTQKENRRLKVANVNLTITERRAAHKELMDSILNPKSDADFDPTTFDPMEGVDHFEVKKRTRKAPPLRLPTMGMLPKELFEGQMVGMFESKQDLYLIMAYYINGLLDRIEELEKKVP